MAEVQRSKWSGVVIEDPRASVWESECVGTPMGPIVGQPVPDNPNVYGEPGLRARYFERSSVPAVTTLTVQAPGVAYPTGSGQVASVVGQDGAGVTQRWMPPWVGLHSDWLSANGAVQVHDWHVAAYDAVTTWGARIYELASGDYEVDLLEWSDVTGRIGVQDLDNFRGLGAGAKVAVLPYEDRALVIVVDGATLTVIEADGSGLLGATSTRWLPLTSAPDTPVRISAARRGTEAVLFVTAATDTYHLASYDGGYSWQYQGASGSGSYVEDVCASEAGFHVVWWSSDDQSGGTISQMRHSLMAASASPWRLSEYSQLPILSTATWNAGAGTITGIGAAIGASESQQVVVVDADGLITVSDDFGGSWLWDSGLVGVFGGHTMRLWNVAATPAKVCLAHRYGRMLATWVAPSGANVNVIRSEFLGGWWASSSHPIIYDAPISDVETRTARPSSLVRWIPSELPGAQWAASAGGGGTETLGAGYMAVTGGLRLYTLPAFGVVPSLAYRAPRTLYSEIRTDATFTAPTANGATRLQVQYYDGAEARVMRVSLTSTTLEVYEDTTGSGSWSLLASVAHSLDLSPGSAGPAVWVSATFVPVDVLSSSDLYVIARAGVSSPLWQESVEVTATSTTDVSGTVTTNLAAIVISSDVNVWSMGYALTTAALVDRAVGKATLDAYLPGRPLSPYGVYVQDGITVEPSPGVATMGAGRSWTVGTDYLYPWSAVLDPSPRTKLRFRSGTGVAKVAIQLDALDIGSGGSTLGVWIGGALAPGLTVETHDGSVWNAVSLTQPLATGTGWDRVGEVVELDGAGSAAPLVRYGEFDGAVFLAGGDAVRRIRQTRAGKARNGDRMVPRLLLSDVVSGDPSSGTTGGIAPRDQLILLDVGAGVRGVRIGLDTDAIDAVSQQELVCEIGRLLVGPVVVFPDDLDWQWSVTTQARTTSEETRDGERRVRVDGPSYRVVQVGWQSGADTLGAVDDADDPDWWHVGQDVGDAMLNTTPQVVEGLHRMLDGDGKQAVLVLRADSTDSAGTGRALVRRHETVFGRLAAELRQDAEQGSAAEEYVWRFDLTLTEDR